MKEIYEMKGAGRSVRGIAEELGIARNTVRRYLKSPESMKPKLRPRRGSKLDPYVGYVDRRMSEGLENCVVLHRELKVLGYGGGYSILKSYVSAPPTPAACHGRRRPESRPRWTGVPWPTWEKTERSGASGRMTLGWSRAKLVRRADTAAFIQCHVNAFEYLTTTPR